MRGGRHCRKFDDVTARVQQTKSMQNWRQSESKSSGSTENDSVEHTGIEPAEMNWSRDPGIFLRLNFALFVVVVSKIFKHN